MYKHVINAVLRCRWRGINSRSGQKPRSSYTWPSPTTPRYGRCLMPLPCCHCRCCSRIVSSPRGQSTWAHTLPTALPHQPCTITGDSRVTGWIWPQEHEAHREASQQLHILPAGPPPSVFAGHHMAGDHGLQAYLGSQAQWPVSAALDPAAVPGEHLCTHFCVQLLLKRVSAGLRAGRGGHAVNWGWCLGLSGSVFRCP